MKIFGTGLQRTGTDSLTTALKKLGFRVNQFPKELYPEIHHPIIHEYDAFIDFPVPLFYKELDKAFPGSKFIHTIRDESKWINSVRWLFTTGRIKFNVSENIPAQTFHQAFYGTNQFDEDLFLARYREYNKEVIAYFADRPADLLVINIAEGKAYQRICPFLGVPILDEPFPYTNKRESLTWVRFQKFWQQLDRSIRRHLRRSRLRPFHLMARGAVSPLPLTGPPEQLSCKPFFIVTSGRSGSTLLRAILNEHPSVCIPPESHQLGIIVRDFMQTYRYLPWSHLPPLVMGELQKERGFAFWNLDLAPFLRMASTVPKKDRNLAYLIDLFYNIYIRTHKPEAIRWGDKSIKNASSLEQLNALFPNAQFIHIYRDGRDVASSLFHEGLHPNPVMAADHWLKSTTNIKNFGGKVTDCRYMEVAYERLVKNPESQISVVCDFLELDYWPDMLNFWQNVDKLGDADRDLHESLKNPINSDAIGRWKQELNASQQASVQDRLATLLTQLGYK